MFYNANVVTDKNLPTVVETTLGSVRWGSASVQRGIDHDAFIWRAKRRPQPCRCDPRRNRPIVVGVAAVDRACKILAAFETSDGALPLTEIAQRTGLHKSTILRITASMERARFLVRLPDRRFAVGPELHRLALLYHCSH